MATPNILKIQADVRAAGIPVRGEPVVVVRKIDGTNSPSQHSYGNAIDWYPTDAREAADAKNKIKVESLERLYSYLKGHPLARVVCYYNRGGCTTAHLDHVHVDASPKIQSQSHLQTVLGQGAGSGSGVDYVGMSAAALGSLDCGTFQKDADLIVGLKSQFSPAQLSALQKRAQECGANNPLLPDFVESPVEGIGDALGSVADFFSIIGSPEFAIRASMVVGGFTLAGIGLYFIAKEFGLPSVTSVAKTGAKVGPASATGGASLLAG
jgi:hypothetical protein